MTCSCGKPRYQPPSWVVRGRKFKTCLGCHVVRKKALRHGAPSKKVKLEDRQPGVSSLLLESLCGVSYGRP